MNTLANELELVSTGYGLLEGPLWHPTRGLLVADATGGGVWSFPPGGERQLAIAHRRGIGGMALHADGGLVVGGRNISLKRFAGEGEDSTVVLLDNNPAGGVIGYNDMMTDAAGRIYVGSLSFVASDAAAREGNSAGDLYLIALDGSARVVARDVKLSNGLGFSPDGKRLYHSDSLRNAVFVYEVLADGSLGEKRPFVNISDGQPDGLAVDAQGTVWVALAHASRVAGYSPEGRETASIGVPVPMVTSLCFGGDGLRELYIVTGSEGQTTDRGGGVYRRSMAVPGLPRPLARVVTA